MFLLVASYTLQLNAQVRIEMGLLPAALLQALPERVLSIMGNSTLLAIHAGCRRPPYRSLQPIQSRFRAYQPMTFGSHSASCGKKYTSTSPSSCMPMKGMTPR